MSKNSIVTSETLPKTVGLIGGGTIGGGWAARFLLNGVNVRLYDPAPGSVDRVQTLVAYARRAYRRLTQVPLPAEGTLTVVGTLAEAVTGVELVQESVPERLELKQQVLGAVSRAAAPETLICSSTSSLRPSLLQADVEHPERLVVAHPFNPVYLLPLVELCAGEHTAPEAMSRAAAIYQALGMHPIEVRKEVDGFIANRLQEAVWREALWLVHDDQATVKEIDDAVCYSFGLRRPVMGPILTYRMACGETPVRKAMERMGAYLKLPWSKLMDVPELTEEFVDKFVAQCDAVAETDNLTEQKRDDCLVAMLQGLRSQGYGAGETLARWEEGLRDHTPALVNGTGPLRLPSLEMPSDWVDYNGHITESRYLELCGYATTNLLRHIGVEGEYISSTGSYYTLETHLFHLRELNAGDRVQVLTQILAADEKRLHVFHVVKREGDEEPAATGEQMLLHVGAESKRSMAVTGDVRERVLELARMHADLPRPERAGASIRMR